MRVPGAQAPQSFNPAATVAPGYWFWRLAPPGGRIGEVIL